MLPMGKRMVVAMGHGGMAVAMGHRPRAARDGGRRWGLREGVGGAGGDGPHPADGPRRQALRDPGEHQQERERRHARWAQIGRVRRCW